MSAGRRAVSEQARQPRPAKVAVIEEVRQSFDAAEAVVLTEYRGLGVAELAQLRRSLSNAGGRYKIFKNTLVRLALEDSDVDVPGDLLTGPTAIAFANENISMVVSALREFARSNHDLVIKGGVLGGSVLSAQETLRLADLPSRDVVLSQLAGAFTAPIQQMAGLLTAVPRALAYGMAALSSNIEASSEGDEGVVVASLQNTSPQDAGPQDVRDTTEPDLGQGGD